MTYQIDQSNKIEHTNKATFVCLTNGKTVICSISASDKQKLKLFFRELDKPLIFKLFTFSVMCAKTLKISQAKSITIDREYKGHERQIRLFIFQILKIEKLPEVEINFGEIGKHSPAHLKVYKAMGSKQKGIKVTIKDVLYYFNKIDKP